ncbi:MAG: DUF5655 domain-containing protein [Anaerolineaceae bacterium]|nr:DUF5655 domain-containing protein [Anaerolineaceae bacterium]
MSDVQIFHATLDGARELKATPFHRERDLQRFIEFHLTDLFGIEFLDTEHSTGPHDKQRIDSLGIDSKGRPVVIEYKLRSDKNIINQGLGYLDWLEKHPESFELLAIKKLERERAQRVDLKHPRLLCIAGAFTRNDIVTAENCKASVELVRYCRYGDSSLLLEWVHGGRVAPKVEREEEARKKQQREAGRKAAETRRRNQEKQQSAEEPDYSKYKNWQRLKDSPELYSLFVALRDYARSQGDNVKVNPTQEYIGFWRRLTLAFVRFQPGHKRLLVYVIADLERTVLREGFSSLLPEGSHFGRCNLRVFIRNHDDLERAKPLIKRSYDEAG